MKNSQLIQMGCIALSLIFFLSDKIEKPIYKHNGLVFVIAWLLGICVGIAIGKRIL